MEKKFTKATIKKIARENGIDISVFSIVKTRRSTVYQKSGYYMLPPYEAMENGDEAWNREYARVAEIYNATVGKLIELVEKASGWNFYETGSNWRGAERAYSCVEYR